VLCKKDHIKKHQVNVFGEFFPSQFLLLAEFSWHGLSFHYLSINHMEKALTRKSRVIQPIWIHLGRRIEKIPSLPGKKIMPANFPKVIMPEQPDGYIKAKKNDCL
jgi:hypothetical protein